MVLTRHLKVQNRGLQAAMEHKRFLILTIVLILGLSSLANGDIQLCEWYQFFFLGNVNQT